MYVCVFCKLPFRPNQDNNATFCCAACLKEREPEILRAREVIKQKKIADLEDRIAALDKQLLRTKAGLEV